MIKENILRANIYLAILLLCFSISSTEMAAQNSMQPATPQEAEALRNGADPEKPLMGMSMVDPQHTGFHEVAGQRRGYGISRIYVNKFSSKKAEQKQQISGNYTTTMTLAPAAHGCNLIIQFKSKDGNYVIEGNNGAVLTLIPEELNPTGTFTVVQYLDSAGNPIDSASLPRFKNVLLALLKAIADRIALGIGSRTEEAAKKIGVGELEIVDIEDTIFDSDSGYKAHTRTWDAKYHDGRWVQGSTLLIIVPLRAAMSIAESVMDQKGIGAFLYTKVTGSSSNIGIMLDNLRHPFISDQQSGYNPQIDPQDMLLVDQQHRGTYKSAGVDRRYGSSYIYLPRLWVKKDAKRAAMSKNFGATISLTTSGTGCNLILQLKAITPGSIIEGNNGGIYLLVPEGLNTNDSKAQVQFLDSSGMPLEGSSLPNLEDILLSILKKLSPGDVAPITEDVFREIGVGSLEPVGIDSTIFDSSSGYSELARSWDDIYAQGRWIKGSILQLSVPLGVSIDNAESLINQHGVGAFIYAKLSGGSANVSVMLDNMRNPFIPQKIGRSSAASTSTIFVVDVSGSMSGAKLEAAKTSVQQVVDLIEMEAVGTSQHQAGLVSFSNDARIIRSLTHEWGKLREGVQTLSSGGGTHIGAGLTKALEVLNGAPPERLIILLSDGRTSDKQAVISGPVQKAAQNAIRIYTVGMGDPRGLDEPLLRQIADTTGGAYYHAINPQDLQQVYRAVQHQARGGEILIDYMAMVSQGETTTAKPLVVPVGVLELYISLSWPGSELDIVLIDPQGRRVDSQYPGAQFHQIGAQKSLAISNPMPGAWQTSVFGKNVPEGSIQYQMLASTKRSPKTTVIGGGGGAQLPDQLTMIEIFIILFSILSVALIVAIIILLYRRRSFQTRR